MPTSCIRCTCAQRLSASQRFSLGRCPHRVFDALVLNAFRHHRGSHKPPGWLSSSLDSVLNAFRHHRGSHQPNARELPDSGVVLNAFRHHRGFSLEQFGAEGVGGRCSTPFGITEVLTRRRGICTPRASVVLNAFRHHRGSHRSRLDISGGRLSGVVFMDLILCGKDPVPMSSRG